MDNDYHSVIHKILFYKKKFNAQKKKNLLVSGQWLQRLLAIALIFRAYQRQMTNANQMQTFAIEKGV